MTEKHAATIKRRTLLRRAAAAAVAPWILPAAARGADGAMAPSNRIALGFIGVGMMGRGHMHGFLGDADVQVQAVSDVDRWRRDDALSLIETAYAARRTAGTYRGAMAYLDFRELLARDDIDGVVIALGERWHPVATVLAAKAGKDIYVEKPVSLTIAESRAMVDAVRRYGRVCQVGLQQRTSPEFQLACRLVHDGALGKVHTVFTVGQGVSQEIDLPAEPTPDSLDWDRWLGPSPWRPFNNRFHYLGRPLNVVPWEFCRDFGSGSIGSGGVHAFDVVQWALRMDESGPVEISPPEAGKYPSLTYKYSNGVLLHVVDGRIDRRQYEVPQGWDEVTRIKSFGAVFVGERGWIHVGRQGFLESYPTDILAGRPARSDPRASVYDHHRNWLQAMRTRCRPNCDVSVGHHSTNVTNLGCVARWTGRVLKWDPAREEFLGDEEANRMRRRAMRAPWCVI
jgi:predicted dehydrogenase